MTKKQMETEWKNLDFELFANKPQVARAIFRRNREKKVIVVVCTTPLVGSPMRQKTTQFKK